MNKRRKCPSWGRLAIHPSSFFLLLLFSWMQNTSCCFKVPYHCFNLVTKVSYEISSSKSLRTELADSCQQYILEVQLFLDAAIFNCIRWDSMQPLPSNLGWLDIRFVAVRNSFGGPCILWIPTSSSCVTHPRHLLVSGNNLHIFSAIITASWVVFSFHFLHHCPRPGRIFPFCPWLVALHEATVSTPHLLPATRIVPVISFRSVRPISELIQPVPHPPCRIYRCVHAFLSGDSSCRRKIVLGLR